MTIVNGTRTLLIASQRLEQSSWAGRLPDVQAGSAFWAATTDAVGLVSGGLASYAPDNTPLPRAEPAHTVNGVEGFGAGTSNSSS